MQLSNMYLSPSQLQLQPPGRDEFIFPMVQSGQSPGQSVDESGIIVYRPDIPHLVLSTSRRSSVYSAVENLSASTTTASTETSTSTTDTVTTEDTRAATPTRSVAPNPSGLSILLARQQDGATSSEGSLSSPTPTAEYSRNGLTAGSETSPAPPSRHSERTPLIQSPLQSFPTYVPVRSPTPQKPNPKQELQLSLLASEISRRLKDAASKDNVEGFLKTSVKSLPAVLLGTLLNILDGVSCESCSFKITLLARNLLLTISF